MSNLHVRLNKLEKIHGILHQVILFQIPPYLSEQDASQLKSKISESNYEDFEQVTNGWPANYIMLKLKDSSKRENNKL